MIAEPEHNPEQKNNMNTPADNPTPQPTKITYLDTGDFYYARDVDECRERDVDSFETYLAHGSSITIGKTTYEPHK